MGKVDFRAINPLIYASDNDLVVVSAAQMLTQQKLPSARDKIINSPIDTRQSIGTCDTRPHLPEKAISSCKALAAATIAIAGAHAPVSRARMDTVHNLGEAKAKFSVVNDQIPKSSFGVAPVSSSMAYNSKERIKSDNLRGTLLTAEGKNRKRILSSRCSSPTLKPLTSSCGENNASNSSETLLASTRDGCFSNDTQLLLSSSVELNAETVIFPFNHKPQASSEFSKNSESALNPFIVSTTKSQPKFQMSSETSMVGLEARSLEKLVVISSSDEKNRKKLADSDEKLKKKALLTKRSKLPLAVKLLQPGKVIASIAIAPDPFCADNLFEDRIVEPSKVPIESTSFAAHFIENKNGDGASQSVAEISSTDKDFCPEKVPLKHPKATTKTINRKRLKV
jgi:hypothetical protein